MKCIIPFKVNVSPIKKLVLIPFEKKPDKTYRGFELQYLDDTQLGKGFRVIAYRNDNYVDVYDDTSLLFQKDEKFNVVENGLNKHIQTTFNNVCFEKQNNCEAISFSFRDLENRDVNFEIKEYSNKKTIPMNLLAPIGYGSKNPDFLPLFFMYDFDFIRRNNTRICCTIGNHQIQVDKFPMPMNMQFRYYARYSNQCELFEFVNTDSTNLLEVEVNGNSYMDGNVEYIFDDINSLKNISVHLTDGKFDISFMPSFNISNSAEGNFRISPKVQMGYLEGNYSIKKNKEKVFIELSIPSGWVAVPTSFLSKMILSKNSIFCKWSKKYKFTEEINIAEKWVNAKWQNNNLNL